MNIILSEQSANTLEGKYTCLPLDLIKISSDKDAVQAYCVLEDIPITEINKIDEYKNLHEKMIENYRKKNWSFCEHAIEHLHGKWGGQMNSFYDEIMNRVAKYKEEDPGEDWDYSIHKY